jgi:hypothetical protein
MRIFAALTQGLLLAALFLATPAQAALITVEPAFQQVSVGDSVDVVGGAVNPAPEPAPAPEALFSVGALVVALAVSRRAFKASPAESERS